MATRKTAKAKAPAKKRTSKPAGAQEARNATDATAGAGSDPRKVTEEVRSTLDAPATNPEDVQDVYGRPLPGSGLPGAPKGDA